MKVYICWFEQIFYVGFFVLCFILFASEIFWEINAKYFLTFFVDMMNAKQFSVIPKAFHVSLCYSFMPKIPVSGLNFINMVTRLSLGWKLVYIIPLVRLKPS